MKTRWPFQNKKLNLTPEPPHPGSFGASGACLGFVEPVLDQEGHLFFSMLHLEEYDIGYRGNGVIWNLGEEKPKELRDPTKLLKEM